MSSVLRTEAAAAHPPLCTDLVPADRVSGRLREALAERAEIDDISGAPRSMSSVQIEALRAMLARVLPAAGDYGMDLALRLDRMMDEQDGNGWRYEALPTDPEAYKAGLDTLDAIAQASNGRRFADLSGEEQDSLLDAIQTTQVVAPTVAAPFDAEQMALWFEEVRSDAVRHYVAHPAIMARIGYSGFANGGRAGEGFAGFREIGIDRRESWEPQPVGTTPAREAVR
ncbi:gluconate 2-dehydrogenase subunit 3 family protein [Aureimonas ureilytica]|uniref:gluconate 2-dehydrogenase subunit 3 family protein n=1 Tax=Aureimonas ureilytica TaxID=401562 RepID=UPI00036DAA48|nr:gluconate 2-dehydrogenase subunit 3 family protein [Aureimonas ureilytica]